MKYYLCTDEVIHNEVVAENVAYLSTVSSSLSNLRKLNK